MSFFRKFRRQCLVERGQLNLPSKALQIIDSGVHYMYLCSYSYNTSITIYLLIPALQSTVVRWMAILPTCDGVMKSSRSVSLRAPLKPAISRELWHTTRRAHPGNDVMVVVSSVPVFGHINFKTCYLLEVDSWLVLLLAVLLDHLSVYLQSEPQYW